MFTCKWCFTWLSNWRDDHSDVHVPMNYKMSYHPWCQGHLSPLQWVLHKPGFTLQPRLLQWTTSNMGDKNEMVANMPTLFARGSSREAKFLGQPSDKKLEPPKISKLKFLFSPILTSTPYIASNNLLELKFLTDRPTVALLLRSLKPALLVIHSLRCLAHGHNGGLALTKVNTPISNIDHKTNTMYHMHTLGASKCMHVVHSVGFAMGGFTLTALRCLGMWRTWPNGRTWPLTTQLSQCERGHNGTQFLLFYPPLVLSTGQRSLPLLLLLISSSSTTLPPLLLPLTQEYCAHSSCKPTSAILFFSFLSFSLQFLLQVCLLFVSWSLVVSGLAPRFASTSDVVYSSLTLFGEF